MDSVVVEDKQEVASMAQILYEKQKLGVFRFESENEHVSPTGKNLIKDLLRTYRDGSGYHVWVAGDWDWSWMVEDNDQFYRGSLPKRLAKYVKHNFGVKLEDDVISEIGNIARANIVPSKEYYMDFDDELDWEDGEFGDSGSCYWGDRWGARNMLRDHGSFAIRFFNRRITPVSNKEKFDGFGRAWIVPDIPFEGSMVTFNAYPGGDLTTNTVALILSQLFSLPYKRIRLSNLGSTDRLLYINCDGRLLGKEDKISEISAWDLEWSEDGYEWEDPDAYDDIWD